HPVRILRPSVVTDGAALTWMLHGTVLYSVHAGEDSRVEVQARPVPGFEPLWKRRFDTGGEVPRLRMTGPYLAINYGPQMILLDPATGQARWRDDDESGGLGAGGEVLLWTADGRVGLLDPAAGRIRWRHEVTRVPIGATATEQHVQVLYDDGTAVAYGRDRGEVVRTVEDLPIREPNTSGVGTGSGPGSGGVIAEGLPIFSATDDLAIVFGPEEITALRLPTLERRWTAEVTAPVGVNRCGTRVCVISDGGVTAFDQDTGEQLWTSAEWTTWSGTLAGSPDGRIARVDPNTGRVLESRGRGRLAGTVVIRADSRQTAVIDQATGRLRAIVPAPLPSCRGVEDLIACQGASGFVTVWRIPKT
ncbi:MAG TPA: PQQ-binding-like beta-propeller repeat protein, partial [Actinoplanes sp.]|nr:PQQ-binding-like beta-propeller repeat protein [Actinoplanes sp.]